MERESRLCLEQGELQRNQPSDARHCACSGAGAQTYPSQASTKGTLHQHACTDLQGSPLGTSACFLPNKGKQFQT